MGNSDVAHHILVNIVVKAELNVIYCVKSNTDNNDFSNTTRKSKTNIVSLQWYISIKNKCKFDMRSLVEELLMYFNNTTEDILNKDWEEIHKDYAYGLEANQFIENSKKWVLRQIWW